ncbi:MAG TPA: hypothetical protein VIK64_12930 [Anaerolineales bacterium]
MKRSLALLLLLGLVACVQAQPTAQDAANPSDIQVSTEELVVVEAAGPEIAAAGSGRVEIIGGSEAELREFVQRWFSNVYPGAPATDTMIYLGSLPQDPPLDLPMPEDARIIASITGHYIDMEVIFDTSLTSEEVKDFYRDALAAAGWEAPPEESQGGGFVPAGGQGFSLCLEDEASLYLTALDRPEAPTDVRLNLNTSTEGFECGRRGPEYYDRGGELIPSLETPAGVEMRGGGMSTGDNEADVSATLKTEMAATELADNYYPQLEAAGWQMLDNASAGGAAWSTWSIEDDRGDVWGGTFVIIETPLADDARFALFRIAMVDSAK